MDLKNLILSIFELVWKKDNLIKRLDILKHPSISRINMHTALQCTAQLKYIFCKVVTKKQCFKYLEKNKAKKA